MIDSGVDLSHEEFAGRPNTFPLNAMTYSGNDEELHGTATASVAAAPENGVGIVGLYPQAKLQLWDASPNAQLTVGDEINGLFAARRRGPASSTSASEASTASRSRSTRSRASSGAVP